MNIFKQNTIELSNDKRIIWESDDKLTNDDIKQIMDSYLVSYEYKLLQMYDDYYEAENTFITDKVHDKYMRGKTPNNEVPTAYYSTIVDTMAGFMFANVQYNPATEQDVEYSIRFNELLKDNHKDVKEMTVGTYSLAYNKAIELIYTTGDSETNFDIKYTPIDPRQAILIYDNSIEPNLLCMVWVRLSNESSDLKNIFLIDVIYKDEWQYLKTSEKSDMLVEREAPRRLFFEECPVIVYNTNSMSCRSPFHKVIKYINALDYLITGNANDVEALADAILVLGNILENDDLQHMDEIKALMDYTKDDLAPYFLTKQMDPAFREYVSKLLIKEIHKHSHTVDYFSTEVTTNEVSGKALRIKLFDMNTYSQKIEKLYRLGTEKKVRILQQLLFLRERIEGEIEVEFNRTVPDELEELAPVLNQLTFISDDTKIEMLGLNLDKEKERMTAQKESNMEMMEMFDSQSEDDDSQSEDDDSQSEDE